MNTAARFALVMWVAAHAARCEERMVRAAGISLRYDSQDFSADTVKREPKLTAKENGSDIPVDVGPERTTIRLDGDRGVIEVIPLRDSPVKNFGAAYPPVAAAAAALRAALASGVPPDAKRLGAADRHTIDGEQSFHARVELIEGETLQGYFFLTQYTQEERPNAANNSELTYVFLGLTRDRSRYIEASFAVKQPSLPADPQATNEKARDAGRTCLRRNETQLAGFNEASFTPAPRRLRAPVRSIAMEGDSAK
jgi:hypothetical protein